tara:strand:- start:5831 stop:6010 length:180 start_codon:yes stop_codon:yes gene_type:complete
MEAERSDVGVDSQGAQPLVALPKNVEMKATLPEDASSEAELLDRLIGQQIVAIFEDANN